MILLPLKLSAAARPKEPAGRPAYVAPSASAASSSSGTSWRSQTAAMAS